jgi:hypothetical protein
MNRLRLGVFALALYAPALLAQPATQLVLVPVFSGGPGAYGSNWALRLTILNASSSPVGSIPYAYACPIPEACPSPIPANASIDFEIAQPTGQPAGIFFNVDPRELAQVAFALRVFDTSREDADHGSEIPVVSAADFTDAPLHLLDVPVDARFRVAVRIYSFPHISPDVTVRVYREPPPAFGIPQEPSVLVSQRTVTLQRPVAGAAIRPSFLLLTDAVTPEMAGPPGSRYRIDVQSATPGAVIWAFASVTNNVSQRVTIVSPSRRLQ